MNYFPAFLDLKHRQCLVVGAGEIAARKIQQLLKAEADVVVVAPELCEQVDDWSQAGDITHIADFYNASHLQGMHLVIAATSKRDINQKVAEDAQARCLPVNVVDDPALCSFIVPSTIDRDPVQIAISTGGASPVLARLLRSRLETFIPSAYGRLAGLMRDLRLRVKQRFPDMTVRRRFWEKMIHGPMTEMFLAGQEQAAMAALEEALENDAFHPAQQGEVYLVGGGPGDPDLLTFRALRLLQQAEVVIYDRLVNKQIVELARRDAEFIYVGKKRDQHTVPQTEINQLLVDLAKSGKRVVRLKGGDPFIFGRGGEEIEHLSAAGVPFQIVPGVTAAAGCASYAGIPLTHRDYAHSCVFVTGHMQDGNLSLNWQALVQPKHTIAVYMGVAGADVLSAQLIKHGMPSDMPVAVVEKGTMQQQQVTMTSLEKLPGTLTEIGVKPPTMIIIGEVVKLHKKLKWFAEGSD